MDAEARLRCPSCAAIMEVPYATAVPGGAVITCASHYCRSRAVEIYARRCAFAPHPTLQLLRKARP